MVTRTDEIRQEIAQVRGDMGHTLEQLGDRVAPAKVVARTKENVAEKVDEVKDRVSPVRVAKRQRLKLRSAFHSFMGADGDGTDLRGAVTQRSGELAGRAGDATNAAVDALQSAPHVARQKAENKPFAAALLSFSAGFLLASVLPPTEREQQLTERLREGVRPIAQEALETGRDAAQALGRSAQQGLEDVKQTAAGSVERIKAETQDRAADVQAHVADAAEEARDQAMDSVGHITNTAQDAGTAIQAEANRTAGLQLSRGKPSQAQS
jgi:gas vesicle protein